MVRCSNRGQSSPLAMVTPRLLIAFRPLRYSPLVSEPPASLGAVGRGGRRTVHKAHQTAPPALRRSSVMANHGSVPTSHSVDPSIEWVYHPTVEASACTIIGSGHEWVFAPREKYRLKRARVNKSRAIYAGAPAPTPIWAQGGGGVWCFTGWFKNI